MWRCTHAGQSCEHRRQWIVDRIKELADIFAIDTCAYAVKKSKDTRKTKNLAISPLIVSEDIMIYLRGYL
jgi:hypothetical protein